MIYPLAPQDLAKKTSHDDFKNHRIMHAPIQPWKLTWMPNMMFVKKCFFPSSNTVDSWNPAPVEVGSLSHYLQVLYIPGGWPWDFWTVHYVWEYIISRYPAVKFRGPGPSRHRPSRSQHWNPSRPSRHARSLGRKAPETLRKKTTWCKKITSNNLASNSIVIASMWIYVVGESEWFIHLLFVKSVWFFCCFQWVKPRIRRA